MVVDPETRETSVDQPYIYWLTRLGAAAAELGRGIPFMVEVSKLLFDGRTDNWHQGDHLARAADRAECDWARLSDLVESDAVRLDQVIETNRLDLVAAGHWGVPTVVFQGEPFFGQDRLDVLTWTMERAGLKPQESG